MVFAMNTVIAFACSVGINMGFNAKHHTNEEAVSYIHKHHKEHAHQQAINHAHKQSGSEQATGSEKSKSDESDCCPEVVKKFQQLDKSISGSYSVVHPLFLSAFVTLYSNFTSLNHADIVRDIKPFVRSYHPPISNIRLAIHLFRI